MVYMSSSILHWQPILQVSILDFYSSNPAGMDMVLDMVFHCFCASSILWHVPPHQSYEMLAIALIVPF